MGLRACAGTSCSLKAIFSASATGWKTPPGPARFGPSLPCIFATTRRSISVMYAKAVSRAKMTMALLMTAATIGLVRKSSMGHLLFPCAHALLAQTLPGEARVERVGFRDLAQHVLRAAVVPLIAQMPCQFNEDVQVCLRAGQRAQGAANSLHVVVDVGHAAVFFGKGHGWQHHVGLLRRFGKCHILHDQEFER